MDHTSLSLLDRVCVQKDDRAWHDLAAVYTPLLHGWLRRYQVQASDADDLTQDVLLVVSRELPTFQHNGRPGAFRSWLRGILVNRLRYFWRSQQAAPAGRRDSDLQRALAELEDPHSGLSHEWNQQHDRHLMHQLLSRIESRFNPSTMQAFRRSVLDSLPVEQVAAELGLSVNAVVIAKCRVLKTLRREARGLLG